MCGISAIFMRESVPDLKVINTLFEGMMARGNNGFGFAWIRNSPNGGRRIQKVFKSHLNYDDINITGGMSALYQEFGIGDVLIGIQRAAPETEGPTDPKRIDQTMQPIHCEEKQLVVVHNGAVMRRIHQELRCWASSSNGAYKFKTDIDSESIIASYIKHGRNMKNAMEYLSGGFATLLYDESKDSLIVANDHMQIAHAYIRGLGFLLHSDNDVLGKIIYDQLGASRDGMFIWENFYHHYLDGGAIREIDLQSGFMRKTKYTPRYIVGGSFDSGVNNGK